MTSAPKTPTLLEQIRKSPHLIDSLPTNLKIEVIEGLEELAARYKAEKARTSFMDFVRSVWPAFVDGPHHSRMAAAFERVANGECKRLIINMPPRHTKSEFASYLLPAWFLGKFPTKKIIQTSHTAELAVGFGRKVRNLVDTEEYKAIFPGVGLQADSKAAGRWATVNGGDYFAIGVGGAVTGKGADCAYYSGHVSTKRGIVPISDVCVGDYVKGYDHVRNKTVWTRVAAISTQFKPELINVGGAWVTPDHRIYSGKAYCRAEEVRDFAVSPMWEGFPAGEEGTRPGSAALRESERGENLLLQSMFSCTKPPADMPVWETQSPRSIRVQSLLSEGKAAGTNLFPMRGILREAYLRGKEKYLPAWGRVKKLLWAGLLRGVPDQEAESDLNPYRKMQKVWGEGIRQADILLKRVLFGANSQGCGIFWGLDSLKAGCKGSGSGDMWVLPAGETAHGGTSYRPRCYPQRSREPNSIVRALPQPLSSSRIGTCARYLKDILQGEGYWVVDIQTGTKNFFYEGVLIHNCLIIDDPHSEQEAALAEVNPEIYDKTYEWYTSGPRQRLQPGGAIVVVMTRWSKRDLTGQVLKAATQRSGEEWEVIEFPAILPSGVPLWPQFWPLNELENLRAELPHAKWMAQYQQDPTSEGAAIVKREWWQIWETDTPPSCEFTLMSWDTAFEKSQRADYSALTTWGVFYKEDATGVLQANIILLNAFRERMEFPRLKQVAIEQYKDWEPDSIIIEKKASGAPLIYEMRAMGIPVQEFTPSKGNDKISRLNAVSDLFASGRVWAPNTNWAEEVIDEVASFPAGEHDDYVDSVSLALMRFRRGGYIRTLLDEEDGDGEKKPFRGKFEGYY